MLVHLYMYDICSNSSALFAAQTHEFNKKLAISDSLFAVPPELQLYVELKSNFTLTAVAETKTLYLLNFHLHTRALSLSTPQQQKQLYLLANLTKTCTHITCTYSRERFSQKPEKWDEVNDWKEKKIVANTEMLPVFLLRRCRRFYLLSAKWSNQSVCILFVSEFRLDLCGLLCAKVVFSFGCANVISIGRALARSFSNSIDPFAFFLDANFFLYRYMHSPASHWTFSQLCDVCFSVDVAVFFCSVLCSFHPFSNRHTLLTSMHQFSIRLPT